MGNSDLQRFKTVFFVVEPSFISPVWFTECIAGLREAAAKQKKLVHQLKKIEEIGNISPSPSSIIILSSNNKWTKDAIDACRKYSIRPILIGGIPNKFGEDVSGTIYSSTSSIEDILYYFKNCGRTNVALAGIDSMNSNESLKVETFLHTSHMLGMPVTVDDIYYSKKPSKFFLDNAIHYNAILCSNDYVASYVIAELKQRGINVPDDMYVAGLGDHPLCQYSSPTITSVSRSYYKTGEQAFHIWKQMSADPWIFSITVTVQCKIIPRESTAYAPLPDRIPEENITVSDDSHSESLEMGSNIVKALSNCIANCDNLDVEIIKRILAGESGDTIAEELFISPGTVRYRIKNMLNASRAQTKEEFIAVFNRYIGNIQVFE